MNRAIFIGIPHAGVALPDGLHEALRSDVDAAFLRSQSDAYTDAVFEGLGADSHRYPWSRFVADPNRNPQDVGPAGAVPRIDFNQVGLYRAGLEPRAEAVQARLAAYHAPYHQQLEEVLKAGGYGLFIDGHAMAAQGPLQSPDAGQPRPAAVLGNRGDAQGELRHDDDPLTCPPTFARAAQEALQAAFVAHGAPPAPALPPVDPRIALNRYFRGGYGVRRHSAPDEGRYGLQLELNQGLWCCPTTFALDEGRLAWMRALLSDWLAALARL